MYVPTTEIDKNAAEGRSGTFQDNDLKIKSKFGISEEKITFQFLLWEKKDNLFLISVMALK